MELKNPDMAREQLCGVMGERREQGTRDEGGGRTEVSRCVRRFDLARFDFP